MWTDLVFNLFLLAIAASDVTAYFFILAVSNCGYIIFNFLNLNAGWIHRMDSGHIARPYKAPTIILGLGAVFAFVNALFMGAGAKVWGPGTLVSGLVAMACVVPFFIWRHYIIDKGQFPADMLKDLHVDERDLNDRRAGNLPYVTLAAGVLVVIFSNWFFQL